MLGLSPIGSTGIEVVTMLKGQLIRAIWNTLA